MLVLALTSSFVSNSADCHGLEVEGIAGADDFFLLITGGGTAGLESRRGLEIAAGDPLKVARRGHGDVGVGTG